MDILKILGFKKDKLLDQDQIAELKRIKQQAYLDTAKELMKKKGSDLAKQELGGG